MKVVTIKFGTLKGTEWVGIRSDFLWVLGFPVIKQKDRQEDLFFRLVVLD